MKFSSCIPFNAIKDVKETEKDIETIRGIIEAYEEDRGRKLKSAFLSDFNFQVNVETIIAICIWLNHFRLLTDMFTLVRLLSCLLRTTTTMFLSLSLPFAILMASKIFTIKANFETSCLPLL